MLEFRAKYLTIHFTLALALNLLIFLHIPELICLMFHLQGIERVYAIAHKCIEFIPITAYTSSFILNGWKRFWCSVLTVFIVTLSAYVSRIFN